MSKYDNHIAGFGKHKGRLVSWIVENDKPYAEWLATQSNSLTKTRRAAQSILDRLKTK